MLVLVTLLAAIAMMVIGNNLARAFGLVGALSIIRFRTVIKDTRDIAFIFAALIGGLAAGTSSYFIAIFGLALVLTTAIVLYIKNFGSLVKTEFILRLEAIRNISDQITEIGQVYTKRMNILEVEGTPGSEEYVQFTYDIVMKDDGDVEKMIQELKETDGVERVKFITSRFDADY
jgi:uncharacterized membrane protein YhiD involved in acid resistance